MASVRAAKDSDIVAAATEGFVEGFIQDKKDTLTLAGGAAFVLVVASVVALDYSAGRAARELAQYRRGA